MENPPVTNTAASEAIINKNEHSEKSTSSNITIVNKALEVLSGTEED